MLEDHYLKERELLRKYLLYACEKTLGILFEVFIWLFSSME